LDTGRRFQNSFGRISLLAGTRAVCVGLKKKKRKNRLGWLTRRRCHPDITAADIRKTTTREGKDLCGVSKSKKGESAKVCGRGQLTSRHDPDGRK